MAATRSIGPPSFPPLRAKRSCLARIPTAAWRFVSPPIAAATASNRPAWVFRDDQGRENRTNNQQARWVAYSGQIPNGKTACVTIFDHPGNPGHPAFWQLRNQYPYLNPSLTCKEAYELEADQSLRLRYRIVVQDGEPIWSKVEESWKAYADGKPRL